MIDARQLTYFVAVCEDKHFARAADRLGIAQSAVSTQIARLEDEPGVRLLNRNKRQPITLSEAGELFFIEAIAALQHLERAEQVGRLAARGLAGTIRLGFIASGATTGLLSKMLKAYRSSYQNVRMRIVAMETPRQLDAIAAGELDAGIVRPRRRYPLGVCATIVHSEHLLVAMSDEDPLARKKVIKAVDLQSQAFIAPQFNEEEGFAETLSLLGAKGGFTAIAEYKVNDFISAISLAAAGYGVALVPASIQRFAQPGSAFKRISEFEQKVHLALAYRERASSPAAQALVRHCLAARAE